MKNKKDICKITYKDISKLDLISALMKRYEKIAPPKKNTENIRIAYKIGDFWCLANYYNTYKTVFLTHDSIVKHCAFKKYILIRKENKDTPFYEKGSRTYRL